MEKYLLDITKKMLAIDSPTGYHKECIKFLEDEAKALGYRTEITQKGNLQIYVEGKSDKTIGVLGHIDTLGLMVRGINANGTLAFETLGGTMLANYDGEYCKIYTREGKTYTGTVLSNSPAAHVYKDARTLERNIETMNIRIDEVVKTKEDVEKLGICNGDFIAIDPKTVITESGFVKSKFLDDKQCVACFYAVLKELKEKNIVPAHNLVFVISVYEEVGHGSCYIPKEISEVLAVDMGCIGKELEGNEFAVSICAKDGSGPYDYDMITKLVNLSKENDISYVIDIFTMYSSDASAALRGGNDIKGALIGPGIHASHGSERTHISAVMDTYKLILAYVLAE